MAIRHVLCNNGEFTLEEFKEWLKKFDKDGDGRISKEELRNAIRSRGRRFSGWRSSRVIRQADSNRNGVIDEGEIDSLVSFAQQTLGMKITTVGH